MNPDPQTRTRTQTRTASRRRISACILHPAEPVTGFCALCLRDRLALAGLDSSDSRKPADFASSLGKSGAGDASSSMRELRRSKSVVAGRCEVSSGVWDQRRRSCDVRASSTLSDLFNRDDVRKGVDVEVKVESKNLGFDNGERIRVAGEVMEQDLDGDDVIGEDLKTMKEHIDLECRSSRKSNARDLREIAGNLLGAASVFSNKLKKWRQKEKSRKRSGGYSGGEADRQAGRDSQSEVASYGFGRRSCDTEPRFSIDANRMSVDDSRFSFDEPRASWDGYLIARTIPRLTPMLSVVDNVMLAPMNRVDNLQMQVINEDVGNSGDSAQSNSDSSSSNRRSSSDRSSSIRSSIKGLGLDGDEMSRISNAKVSPTNDVIFHGTKLVITERELKDWHLNSLKHGNLEGAESISIGAASSIATGSASNGFKKARASRWRKVCNLWGYKHRLDDKKGGDFVGNAGSEKPGSEIDGLEKGDSGAKLIRSSSVVNLRNTHATAESNESARGCSKKGREEFVLERNKSGRHSMSDLDSGLLRFHLTPFRNYSRSKSGKSRVKYSPAMARNGLLLN